MYYINMQSELLGKCGGIMGKKYKCSMQDIAKRLGISKNAVSLALNNKPGVSEQLRQQIIKTAQEMNYSGLSYKRKNNNILVLIPEYIRNDTYFYNDIYWSIENEAKLKGYNAILTSVSEEMESELRLPGIYFDMNFSGILIIGVFRKNFVKKLLTLGLPIISVDHYYDDIMLDSVVTANVECAYMAVQYLIDNGHKDIGYIGSIDMTASLYERWIGYLKAMRKNNLEVNKEHCITKPSSLYSLLNEISEIEKSLDEMSSFPTAWFCGGDRIAYALINVLTRRGIKVPDDISVMGFDDLQASSIIVPNLTTVRVKRQSIGAAAINLMTEKIEKGGDVIKYSIYGELVIRDSVKKI